jgi:hypothetical protein
LQSKCVVAAPNSEHTVSIRAVQTASQGYFSVGTRDGDTCEGCSSSGSGSPFQKVRAVATINYDLA